MAYYAVVENHNFNENQKQKNYQLYLDLKRNKKPEMILLFFYAQSGDTNHKQKS